MTTEYPAPQLVTINNRFLHLPQDNGDAVHATLLPLSHDGNQDPKENERFRGTPSILEKGT